MEYIIFDLEWNQPSYNSIRVTSPVFLEGEIIEIGAVKTNEDCDLLDTFKIIITPKYYTKMNSNVSKLTGIKNKDLMLGIVFPDAFRAFMKWCGKNSVFMSWSNNDLRVLRQNLRVFNMDPNEYMKDVFDLQQIFDKQILHEGRGCGLNEALEKVGEKGMEAHDALHDAINTFYVCKHLDLQKGLQDYVATNEVLDEGEALNVFEQNYSSVAASFKDKAMNSFVCEKCGESVVCLPWASNGKGKKISIAQCTCGKKYYLKSRYFKLRDDKRRVLRLLYPGSNEFDEIYREKARKQEERFQKRLNKIKENRQ